MLVKDRDDVKSVETLSVFFSKYDRVITEKKLYEDLVQLVSRLHLKPDGNVKEYSTLLSLALASPTEGRLESVGAKPKIREG